MEFKDKVVLITGGSSGIGADAAFEFARKGAKVALVGRNESRLNTITNKIKGNSSATPLIIMADVRKDSSRIIDETIQHFFQLDVLVNCAGIFESSNIITTDIDVFDRIMDTNVRSVIQLTKFAIPHLEKTKGNIVNISSHAGPKPFKEYYAYCMSKAALDMYTKCASLELAPKGVRVNSVNPGTVKTPIFLKAGIRESKLEDYFEEERKDYPVGRVGEVSDTSNAILFLANEKSSFINGVLLLIDGGNMWT